MIKIKMFDEKWQLEIGDYNYGGERWQFNTLKEMQEVLDKILKLKEKYGRVG